VGVGVCPEAGVAVNASAKLRMETKKRLIIDESQLVPDLEIRNPVGVDFQYVFCGTFREICQMPGLGVDGVNHGAVCADPKNCQICEYG